MSTATVMEAEPRQLHKDVRVPYQCVSEHRLQYETFKQQRIGDLSAGTKNQISDCSIQAQKVRIRAVTAV